MCTGEFHDGRSSTIDWHPIENGLEIIILALRYRNRRYVLTSLTDHLARIQTLPFYHLDQDATEFIAELSHKIISAYIRAGTYTPGSREAL